MWSSFQITEKCMSVKKFIEEMDVQATKLWQGKGIEIGELNTQILNFVTIMESELQEISNMGIEFPVEYTEDALLHLKQAMIERDDYKLADCLYYEWREIAIVLQEVLDEVA